ncbi:MAG: methenyltetrahydromethanopterin cyclohydrolase [Methanosarcinales archaeon]
MISVNEYGIRAFDEMLNIADELNIEVLDLSNGATVVDAGVNARGGYDAGIFLSRICMADLADIEYVAFNLKDITVPAIRVATDHPVIACMASQYAGWRISIGKYFAMGSGPARALSLNPKKLYKEIGYEDQADEAVLVLESNALPNEKVTEKIAKDCGVETSDLYIAVAPTASIAGSVQISARVVETGIHKLESVGFDINTIKNGYGIAPIAPIVGDDTKCMGSTNDCIIYCGKTYYTVDYKDNEGLKNYIKQVPSNTSRDYGKPFYITFKDAGFDFFKVDAGMFAPAEISVNELNSAKTYHCGKINPDVLLESFGIERL